MIHEVASERKITEPKCRCSLVSERHRIVAELDALQAEVDALKRLQAEIAAELDTLLPALLDRAFKGTSQGRRTTRKYS